MKVKLLVLGILATLVVGRAADWETAGKRWWAHIEYLADDKLEGRETGSEGHRRAAAYVAEKFAAAGLKPGGTPGYFQTIPFGVRQLDEAASSLTVVAGGKAEPVKLGEEAILGARSEATEVVQAPAVFVGHGLSIPEANHDDLAGLDLRGKIAVYLSGGPGSIPGPLKAHYQSRAERWKAMQKAGVIGLAVIPNPRTMDIPWARASLSRLEPSMSLADPALQDTRGMQVVLEINPERADKFFAGTGHTIAEILAAADADRPLPHFPLAASFRIRLSVKRWEVESQNVLGLLPGSDPALKDEYVVLSAHLDHVGAGAAINGDKIYNGAMDDASGIASLLEIARGLHEARASLKRSLVFAAVTGEEKGLLGSKYFVHHPTIPIRNVVANINMDMFLPLFPLRYLEVQGVDESTLGDDIRAVAQAAGVEVQRDKEPNRNRFIRSDQYSFIRRGIPALAFKFGYVKGEPEEKVFMDWLRNRYHAPSDDTKQPLDLAAAAQFNQIILELAKRVAEQPERPQWKKESFFRRFAD